MLVSILLELFFKDWRSAFPRDDIETQVTRFWVQGSGLRITNTKIEG
jgi:hypothetical protein